jgi:hypothetical protein
MYERGHDHSYHAAFHAANEELNELYRRVELLRMRKDRVEKVLEALKPLLDSPVQGFERELTPEPVQRDAAEYTSAPAQAAASAIPAPRNETPASGDPFQNRINSILGLAVA